METDQHFKMKETYENYVLRDLKSKLLYTGIAVCSQTKGKPRYSEEIVKQ